MTSVRKSRVATRSIVAALGIFAGGFVSANAADLGGNCCADLEERIAELEATTARKGNRKVSLTISGWVNEEILFWDDGTERNAYVGTNNLEQSRFRFVGEAKIVDNWSAGYTIEIGVSSNASNGFSQSSLSPTGAGGTSSSIIVRKSNWWIKNKDYGKLTVGQEGTATYHLLDDADGANTRNFSDVEAASVALGAFQLRSGGLAVGPTPLKWTDALRGFNNSTPGQDGRRDIIRYDSPAIMGFVATASWGEDDLWDVALTYTGKIADFKLVGKAGYGQGTDEIATKCHTSNAPGTSGLDCQWWGVAGTVMHEPTGLYVYGAYGNQHDNRATDALFSVPGPIDQTDTTWFVQAGIEQKFVALGKTTIFGEYRRDEAGSVTNDPGPGNYVLNSKFNFWAAGVVQNIDAAAMDVYVIYRHADGDLTNNLGAVIPLDAMDMVQAGALIKF